MAAKRRHWKEKDGRFWARMAIPIKLRSFFGNKSELLEPLGGDLRIADRNHAAAVARLQAKLASARAATVVDELPSVGNVNPVDANRVTPEAARRALTEADAEHAVWEHYSRTLADDAARRAAMPTPRDIELEREKLFQRIEAGEIDLAKCRTAFSTSTPILS